MSFSNEKAWNKYKERLSRKLFVASTTIILLFCVNVLFSVFQTDFDSVENVRYFQDGQSFVYTILFYGIFLYGIPASLLSDSLAKSISNTTGKREIYIAAVIHVLAGLIVGLVSLIPAVTFFLIDRFLLRKRMVYFPFNVIMVGSLCVITYIFKLNLGELFGL